MASRKDLLSTCNGICCLFTGKYNFGVVMAWGLSTLFTIVALDEKMDLHQIAQRKFDARECKLRNKSVQRWYMPHLHTYFNTAFTTFVAFTTFAQIYSLVCTFLHQIWAARFWFKSIFSPPNRKKRRKRK